MAAICLGLNVLVVTVTHGSYYFPRLDVLYWDATKYDIMRITVIDILETSFAHTS